MKKFCIYKIFPTKQIQAAPGFSLTEMLVTSSLIGLIASIAVPGYIGQKNASCQSYPESIIEQAMSQAQAYNDEYASAAKSWKDLDKISTIMTSSGPAQGETLNWIELPKCNYKLMGSQTGNEYTFIAVQSGAFTGKENDEIDSLKNNYNVVACINVATGASDIQRGNGEDEASTTSLRCS